jgi:hypothetical protein
MPGLRGNSRVFFLKRMFSAGGFALTVSWGAAPGCHERCAFGAKQHAQERDYIKTLGYCHVEFGEHARALYKSCAQIVNEYRGSHALLR